MYDRLSLPDQHTLLNKDQFKARLMPLGYHYNALGKLFMTLARSSPSIWPSQARSSDDIAYAEINRQGRQEVVLSVPNLAARLDEVRTMRDIGSRSIAICQELIDLSAPIDGPPQP